MAKIGRATAFSFAPDLSKRVPANGVVERNRPILPALGLHRAKLAWREIAWKSCLLDGLRESREKQKPVLLWIFIDRPSDDARC